MSLESKIDALKASIDALTLTLESKGGTQQQNIPNTVAPVIQPAVVTPAVVAPAVTPAVTIAPAGDPAVEAAKIACRNALAATAQRLGTPARVVELLASYIRPGSQPAGTPPNIDHVEPAHYAQLAAAAQALQ